MQEIQPCIMCVMIYIQRKTKNRYLNQINCNDNLLPPYNKRRQIDQWTNILVPLIDFGYIAIMILKNRNLLKM